MLPEEVGQDFLQGCLSVVGERDRFTGDDEVLVGEGDRVARFEFFQSIRQRKRLLIVGGSCRTLGQTARDYEESEQL
jgi:hypothetical protein